MAQSSDIEDVLTSIRRLVAGGRTRERTRIAATTKRSDPAASTSSESSTGDEIEPSGRTNPLLVLAAEQRITEPENPFQMIRSLAQEERDARDEEFITDDLPDEVAAITEDIPLILREAGANAAEDAGPSDDAAFQVPWPREWETSASDLAAQNETSFLTASDDDAGNSPFEAEFVEEPAFGSGDLQDTFAPAPARARDRDVLTLTDRDLVSAPDGPAPGSPTDDAPPVSVPEISDGTDPQADHLRPVEPLLPLPAETTASSVNSSDLGSDFDAEEQSPLVGPGEQDQGVEDDLESSIGSERLRQLIAEVVREELSGELGERITRNLRKLVRREIERALASSDFD